MQHACPGLAGTAGHRRSRRRCRCAAPAGLATAAAAARASSCGAGTGAAPATRLAPRRTGTARPRGRSARAAARAPRRDGDRDDAPRAPPLHRASPRSPGRRSAQVILRFRPRRARCARASLSACSIASTSGPTVPVAAPPGRSPVIDRRHRRRLGRHPAPPSFIRGHPAPAPGRVERCRPPARGTAARAGHAPAHATAVPRAPPPAAAGAGGEREKAAWRCKKGHPARRRPARLHRARRHGACVPAPGIARGAAIP